MATRSTIGIKKKDGSIDYIYAHWDGYPEHNGKILLQSYTDVNKVKALISLGSLSILDKEIDKPEGHSFENRTEGYTVFYGRDRGESDTEAQNAMSEKKIQFEEYSYLFDEKNNEWLYSHGKPKHKKLTAKDCGIDESEVAENDVIDVESTDLTNNSLAKKIENEGLELLEPNKTHINRIQIPSASSNKVYVVAQNRKTGTWGCSCRGWIFHRHCKHLDTMEPILNELEKVETALIETAKEEIKTNLLTMNEENTNVVSLDQVRKNETSKKDNKYLILKNSKPLNKKIGSKKREKNQKIYNSAIPKTQKNYDYTIKKYKATSYRRVKKYDNMFVLFKDGKPLLERGTFQSEKKIKEYITQQYQQTKTVVEKTTVKKKKTTTKSVKQTNKTTNKKADKIKYKTHNGKKGNAKTWEEQARKLLQRKNKGSETDYLKIIGLRKKPASLNDLKKAWKKAITAVHPDLGYNNHAASLINQAYQSLSASYKAKK